METKRFVSKYKNPLLKYLDEMNTTMFFVLMFVGILLLLVVLYFYLIIQVVIVIVIMAIKLIAIQEVTEKDVVNFVKRRVMEM